MLTKNSVNRTLKISQVKSHIWYSDFDWEGLISMNIEAAYVSKIDSNKMENKTIPFTKFIEVKFFKLDKTPKMG
jgi:hypothetical protein